MRSTCIRSTVRVWAVVQLWTIAALLFVSSAGAGVAPDGVHEADESVRAPGPSPAAGYQELTRAQFDAISSSLATTGKYLVDIEVRWDGAQELYTAVWFPVSGTIHTLIQGTPTDWNTFISSVTSLPGRWLDVEVGYFGADKKYSAIYYEGGEDYLTAVHTTNSDSLFQTYLDTYMREGRSIIDFEAYSLPSGATRFAGVWAKGSRQPPTHLVYNLEADDVAALLDPMQGRIIDIERYHSSLHGEDRFGVILAVLPGGAWGLYRNQTWTSIAELNDSISNSYTHLIDLDPVIISSGAVRYNAVWGRAYKALNEIDAMPAPVDSEPIPASLSNLVNAFQTTAEVGTVGLYAKNLRTEQSIGYRPDEMFYLASATKTAIHIKFWKDIEAGRFNRTDPLGYTSSRNTGDPWYVDERDPPGFASGAPGLANDLGMAFPLVRFDEAMMTLSDNAATSALVLDTGIGAAYASQDLTEWLASEPGLGRGWGVVTAIQDADRHIIFQGQQHANFVSEPSYFLAPRFTLGPLMRGTWRVCTIGGVRPEDCVGTACTRCQTDDTGECSAGESCVYHPDPWGELTSFFGLSAGEALPSWDIDREVGYPRYYASGLNAATPRAVGNLWEGLVENRFLSAATTAEAMGYMNEGTPFWNAPDRPNHVRVVAKGGAKHEVCADTGVFQYGDERIVLAVLTKDLTRACSNPLLVNDVRDIYMPLFANELLLALAADLAVVDPAADASVAPAEVRPGENVAGLITVTNTTGGDADPVDVRFYLSPDDVIDANDWLIGELRTNPIPGHGSQLLVEGQPLGALNPGLYYFGWIVDAALELDELNEDNTGYHPTQIRVQAPLVEIADVRFTDKTTAQWTPTADTAYYRISEGTSATLPLLLDGTLNSCQLSPPAEPVSSEFVSTPPPGELYWYLVRGEGDGPILPSSFGPRVVHSTGECGASCAHPRCEAGVALEPMCDKCVGRICEYDSYCCNTHWDNLCVQHVRTVCNSLVCDDSTGACAHNVCVVGDVLVPGCDDPPVSPSCVSQICSADPYCCDTMWDNLCVEEVVDFCGATCE